MSSARREHLHNASVERRYISDAERDARNETATGRQLQARGLGAEAQFHFQEAENSQSWVGKRKGILNHELELAGESIRMRR